MKDKCPFCGNIVDDEEYSYGQCSGCGADYYWDFVYDEELNEEMFQGRYYDSKDCKGYINVRGVEIE